MSADGSGQTDLTNNAGLDNGPAWQPLALAVALAWEPPAGNVGASPTELTARVVGVGSAPASSRALAEERAPGTLVTAYNVYRAGQPTVPVDSAHLFTTVPPTQTTATAPLVEGGSFFVVTALYDTVESDPSNEVSAGTPGATVSKVKVKPAKIVATGRGFTSPVEVFVDGIAISPSPKVNAAKTRVVQKGRLATGATFRQYITPGKNVKIAFVNSDQGITTVTYPPQ